MNYIKDFNNGLKINNDLNNRKEGPHWDIMTDLRNDINGIEKIRIRNDGSIINGDTQIGPVKLPWQPK